MVNEKFIPIENKKPFETVYELKNEVEEIRLPMLSEITDKDGKVKLPPELIEKLRDPNARFRTDLVVCPVGYEEWDVLKVSCLSSGCNNSSITTGCTNRGTDQATLAEALLLVLSSDKGVSEDFARLFLKNAKERQTEPIKREDLAQSGRIRGFMETALLALDNELTQSLLDIYNVLNNQGKEFSERTSNEAGENISRMTPEERRRNFYNTFIASQKMMEVAKARQKELEGKTYEDMEIKNPFSGNPDKGKKLFGQIKNKQSANPSSVNLDKVVENLKADPKNY
ncbi:12621_t:CDS:2 [Ambispora gerdemannii]|uniref:12621_t:CDS:1 n=1 Tax=Ambispora gerdemannii TaxID=144530 RepID=A0A9N9AZK5_9GLOM|nr:12621_t:CDS:2 [Ambispora gerdemannii]